MYRGDSAKSASSQAGLLEGTRSSTASGQDSVWLSQSIVLTAKPAGFHLITDDIVAALPEINTISIGLLHLFMQHTSASLAVNENADPDVRADLKRHFEELAPRDAPYYRHTLEGSDDMPAHIKSVLTGTELTLPVRDGQLALGVWQGVYLCEHRDYPSNRTVLATLNGSI